jgi:hypothetical protein
MQAGLTSASGAPRTMHIRLHVDGRVVVHDVVHPLHIHASGHGIGAHQHLRQIGRRGAGRGVKQ